ncbi:MAG: sigma-70 family RNA polymerase sigma factor [Alistipes sp.]|nr:sigma-70 family RNA polymerase sigma factor [Alistipes sp.]
MKVGITPGSVPDKGTPVECEGLQEGVKEPDRPTASGKPSGITAGASPVPDVPSTAAKSGLPSPEAVERLYVQYREPFVRFAASLGCRERQTALDHYNDSFISFQENIASGRLTNLNCSLKTYIFAVGRNKILRSHRDASPLVPVDFRGEFFERLAAEESAGGHLRSELARQAVDALREPCSTVLRLYYWEQLGMEEIARRMKYRNGQVAKNRKHLCMGLLRESLLKLFRSHGMD